MGFLLNIPHESMTVIQWGVVIGASLVAAAGDIRHHRIPNALTFPLLVVGLIWAGWFGGWVGVGEGAMACLLLSAPYVLLFVFAGGGAGDAKLMGAIGAWLGLRQGLIVLLCVAVIGGALAIAKALMQRRLKFVLTNVLISFYTFVLCVAGGRRPKPAAGHADSADNAAGQAGGFEVPYGVAICSGVCAAAAIVWIWGVDWLW